MRSVASCFNFQYLFVSLSSSSSCFYVLLRLLFISILPAVLLSKTYCRRQFPRKMWSIHLAQRVLLYVGYHFPPWLYVTLLRFSHDRSNWSSPSFFSTTFRNFLVYSVSAFLIYTCACTNLYACMYEFKLVHVRIYTCACTNLHVFMYEFTRVHVRIYTYACTNLRVCMYGFTRVHVRIYTCACTDLHVFRYEFTRVHVRIYTCACMNLHVCMYGFTRVHARMQLIEKSVLNVDELQNGT